MVSGHRLHLLLGESSRLGLGVLYIPSNLLHSHKGVNSHREKSNKLKELVSWPKTMGLDRWLSSYRIAPRSLGSGLATLQPFLDHGSSNY